MQWKSRDCDRPITYTRPDRGVGARGMGMRVFRTSARPFGHAAKRCLWEPSHEVGEGFLLCGVEDLVDGAAVDVEDEPVGAVSAEEAVDGVVVEEGAEAGGGVGGAEEGGLERVDAGVVA